jgi:hypothetical protein
MSSITQAVQPFMGHRAALETILQSIEDQIDALLSMPETKQINTLLTSLSVQAFQLQQALEAVPQAKDY